MVVKVVVECPATLLLMQLVVESRMSCSLALASKVHNTTLPNLVTDVHVTVAGFKVVSNATSIAEDRHTWCQFCQNAWWGNEPIIPSVDPKEHF